MTKVSKVFTLFILFSLFSFFTFSQNPKIPPKGEPLKGLKKCSDGHYTPYNLPNYPKDAKIHIVKSGDTLWDLAKTYLNNPYLWPQIWEKNSYITNPHWIYPGDPILIEKPAVIGTSEKKVEATPEKATEEKAISTKVKTEKPNGIEVLKRTIRHEEEKIQNTLLIHKRQNKIYYGSKRELYGTGFITKEMVKMDAFIIGAEDEDHERYLGEGEIVYLNKGMNQNVVPGAKFEIIRNTGKVFNPITKKFVGYYYKQIGILKVLISHDTNSIAKIEYATDAAFIGDGLLNYEKKNFIEGNRNYKMTRFMEDTGKATGNVVFIENYKTFAGQEEVIYLDLGKNSGIKPGDYVSIYTRYGKYKVEGELGRTISQTNFKPSKAKDFKRQKKIALKNRNIPRVINGDAIVLEVYDTACKAIIVENRKPIHIGDYAQIK